MPLIGASDLTDMLVDYVLTRIADTPHACWTACEIDHVADDEIVAATAFAPEVLAAAFIGTVVELSFWQSDEGYRLLSDNGMSADDAREFAAALDVVTEKIAARGQGIIQHLNDAPTEPFAPRSRY